MPDTIEKRNTEVDSTYNSNTKITTVDGVDIIDEGDVIHFIINEELERRLEEIENERIKKRRKKLPWYKRLANWFKKHTIGPYVKIRNQSDPLDKRSENPSDYGVGKDGRSAVEIGIRGTF